MHGIMELLQISHATYTADLSLSERSELIEQFTTNPTDCMIFISSYAVHGVGLSNRGQREQAIGRQREKTIGMQREQAIGSQRLL